MNHVDWWTCLVLISLLDALASLKGSFIGLSCCRMFCWYNMLSFLKLECCFEHSSLQFFYVMSYSLLETQGCCMFNQNDTIIIERSRDD